MNLTKYRLQKIINNKSGKQTRKKFKKTVKVLNHTNTVRHRKQFNLHNRTISKYII